MKRILLLLLTILSSLCMAVGTKVGPYSVKLTTQPTVIEVGSVKVDLFVTDSSDSPVQGATVRLIAQMPGMAMGEREQVAIPGVKPGHYLAPAVFAMAGAYKAKITIDGPGGVASGDLDLQTGESTLDSTEDSTPISSSSGSAMPWLAAGTACVLFALIWTRRKSLPLKRIFNASFVGGVVLLLAVVVVAKYAIDHFRRPGSMTPVEAQTMDMSIPPPPGVAPVTLAEVTMGSGESTVTYPGQVVALSDAEVAARTTGVVQATYVYVGDHVKAGQLLARLDVSQLGPELAQKQAMVESAVMAKKVAEADAIQAGAMVHQAESEKGQFEGAVSEVMAMRDAAKEDVNAAMAQRDSAKSLVADADAKVTSAKADANYWTEEIKREGQLFRSGAVSKDEFAQEQRQSQQSSANLEGALRNLDAAKAGLKSAEAQVRKANAGQVAATERVRESQSALMVHHAHVQTAQAETESANGKIGEAVAGVRQAKAELDVAAATRSYAELRAPLDGVVTARMVSPGTLVNPGQVMFRVSSVATLRIQANVTESDLQKVRKGMMLSVRHRDSAEKPTRLPVSSISPSIDPVSRMGVVEGLLTSRDGKFVPGQFVSVEVPVVAGNGMAMVPSQAVQTSLSESGNSRYVWLVHPIPGQPNRYQISRQRVELGAASGDLREVISGLSEGDRVVLTGAADLQDGDSVTVR